MDKIVPIERKLTSERTARVFMMRKSVAEMEEALENYQKDAMHEIRRTAVILAGQQMGPKDYSIEKIRATFGGGDRDAVWVMDQVLKYDDWKKAVDERTFNITWDATVYCTSAREVAERQNCSHPTVMKYLRLGLDEYANQQGWIKKV